MQEFLLSRSSRPRLRHWSLVFAFPPPEHERCTFVGTVGVGSIDGSMTPKCNQGCTIRCMTRALVGWGKVSEFDFWMCFCSGFCNFRVLRDDF